MASREQVSSYWFVGSNRSDLGDLTSRFVSEGIWELRAPSAKDKAMVLSMKPGDRIAIKATYTRKHGLPFDNRGHSVSVMAIKAIGTVIKNPQDGERVHVDWTLVDPAREWYFFTYMPVIWRITPRGWMTDDLIAFTFDGKPQDLDRFCNAPYWRERYGSGEKDSQRFGWTRFYEAMAESLLEYRHRRQELLEALKDISTRTGGLLDYLASDRFADESTGYIRDICPFTTMGLFNRGIKVSNRKIIAQELATFLGVEEAVPETFEGIPVLNNQKSWFFPFEFRREADHIDALWDLFAACLDFTESDDETNRSRFSETFDNVSSRRGVRWNLTMGMYWIRPWGLLSLDTNSRVYITGKLDIPIEKSGPGNRCSSEDYLSLIDTLQEHFQESSYPVHSFPELSYQSWNYKPSSKNDEEGDDDDGGEDLPQGGEDAAVPLPASLIVTYGVDDIIDDGCFFGRKEIERLLTQLRGKKNLILQGPPGTGKTWLAKRLAYAMMGQKDDSKVRAVQFHPNLSYEDFVRGWRPSGDGRLTLADGIFMEVVKSARKDPKSLFFVVIEEINRGNPSQIFGELLTLLEAGKRTPNEALELCYPDPDGKRHPVYIPENLYVIGTMNIADRSLALVDLALRRRFAFVDLEPRIGQVWRNWVVNNCNVEAELAVDIEQRIKMLNDQIEADPRLGRQFLIGHSYVTPPFTLEPGDTRNWFRQVVETEIGPLLEEYWFDAPNEATMARDRLVQNW